MGGRALSPAPSPERFGRRSATPQPGAAAAHGGPEAVLVDAPEVVLLAVHEDHGDVLPVPLRERGVVEDGELLPGGAGVRGHSLDHGTRVVAQMTARLADESDPRHQPRVGRRPRYSDGM